MYTGSTEPSYYPTECRQSYLPFLPTVWTDMIVLLMTYSAQKEQAQYGPGRTCDIHGDTNRGNDAEVDQSRGSIFVHDYLLEGY